MNRPASLVWMTGDRIGETMAQFGVGSNHPDSRMTVDHPRKPVMVHIFAQPATYRPTGTRHPRSRGTNAAGASLAGLCNFFWHLSGGGPHRWIWNVGARSARDVNRGTGCLWKSVSPANRSANQHLVISSYAAPFHGGSAR